MYNTHHSFHIPVMGTGFTIDAPLKVARFGISSVISIVDDMLIDRIRRHYAKQHGRPDAAIPASHPDARAARITTYLDLVHDLLEEQMAAIKALPFAAGNEKTAYFEMLPDSAALKQRYLQYLSMEEGAEKQTLDAQLTAAMRAGHIDCNIMTKLDPPAYDTQGQMRPPEFSDAKAALRGFALSKVRASIVMSAGINPSLYGYLESFPDFYRLGDEPPKKGVILKVSDFRSSMVQGRFLGKKGIEVREFRIESGLNCGGHAFAANGYLLGPILQEFRDSREQFPEMFEPLITTYFEKKGKAYPASGLNRRIPVTAQGGIGNFGEVRRLMEYYGMDATGWASPFLLVPEVTAVDDDTRQQLMEAREEDLYLSDVSPLGVAFNNLRNSGTHRWTEARIRAGKPGSPCPKGYLALNTEFTEKPICTASMQYQKIKLASIGYDSPPPIDTEDARVQAIYEKSCICDQLGNGALIQLGMSRREMPVSVCPGPNIAYFNKLYSLREMVDHIYGRGESLVPAERPHFFVKDMLMTIEFFGKRAAKLTAGDEKSFNILVEFRQNVKDGIEYYRTFVGNTPFPGENLESLKEALPDHEARLESIWDATLKRLGQPHTASSPA